MEVGTQPSFHCGRTRGTQMRLAPGAELLLGGCGPSVLFFTGVGGFVVKRDMGQMVPA